MIGIAIAACLIFSNNTFGGISNSSIDEKGHLKIKPLPG
jgi:hypothetical protein